MSSETNLTVKRRPNDCRGSTSATMRVQEEYTPGSLRSCLSWDARRRDQADELPVSIQHGPEVGRGVPHPVHPPAGCRRTRAWRSEPMTSGIDGTGLQSPLRPNRRP
jgi:hypothetical protein